MAGLDEDPRATRFVSERTEASPAEDAAPEVQRADPRLRVLAFVVALVVLVGGGLAILWLEGRLDEAQLTALRSPSDAAQDIIRLTVRVFGAFAAAAGVLGSWFLVVAWKTLRAERFPPPGVGVIRDTRVVTGGLARLRGYVGLVLAFWLLAVAFLLPTVGARFVYDRVLPVMLGGD